MPGRRGSRPQQPQGDTRIGGLSGDTVVTPSADETSVERGAWTGWGGEFIVQFESSPANAMVEVDGEPIYGGPLKAVAAG